MSANNQIIVAPYPENLDKYAVWHDGCVDNPFDFSAKPIGTFDTLEEAIEKANAEEDRIDIVEYGMSMILRKDVLRYEMRVWDEFPDYKYLGVVRVPVSEQQEYDPAYLLGEAVRLLVDEKTNGEEGSMARAEWSRRRNILLSKLDHLGLLQVD